MGFQGNKNINNIEVENADVWEILSAKWECKLLSLQENTSLL